jgi:aryl-alcohol dehydrogenase-like predicted oxidoreductase
LLENGVVDASIVGPTSTEHLEEAVQAVDLSLDGSDAAWLEEPYEPVLV